MFKKLICLFLIVSCHPTINSERNLFGEWHSKNENSTIYFYKDSTFKAINIPSDLEDFGLDTKFRQNEAHIGKWKVLNNSVKLLFENGKFCNFTLKGINEMVAKTGPDTDIEIRYIKKD